jgi:hypothetical protein
MKPPSIPGGQQRIVEGALDTLRPGWRERRAKRKSPWDFVGLVVAVLVMGPVGYGLWLCAWKLHLVFYPEHASHVREFWRAGISGRAFISSFLLAMPLFMPAMVTGFLVSNFLMWLIPPARRAMNAEAAGAYEMTFRGANWGLIKWGGIASGVAFLLVLIGAVTLTSLR